jgi:hypothetical protein
MGKIVKYDGKVAEVRGIDLIGGHAPKLDSIDSNLSVFFQRQLEFLESELQFVEYGDLKSWKHIPIESKGGDNLWYTWRLFDKVGMWRISSDDADDVPEVNVMGAELPVPIRMLTGGFKYNVRELLAGKQSASNNPNAPSIMVEQQKAIACQEAYQQIIDKICWYANPANAAYAGLTGIFYNTYIATVAAVVGGTSTKTHWFGASGQLWKTPDEVISDLNLLLTTIKVNTLDRYAADTLLMPIEHFNMLSTTRITGIDKTILQFFLGSHPEITTVDTLVAAKSVPAGGSIATATDIILAYKKDPKVCKLALPRQYTMMPIQERGFNYIVPCYATTAGVITQRPKAMAMLTGSSIGGVGSA